MYAGIGAVQAPTLDTNDEHPKGSKLVSTVNPSRIFAEHIFKRIILRLLRIQDVILFNPSGRVASRTYIVLSPGDHTDS